MKLKATFLDEISHDIPHQNWGKSEWDADFSYMESYSQRIIAETLANGLPKGTCLNVNAPKGEITGIGAEIYT